MADTLSQLERLTSGHGYAPGADPGVWGRFFDDVIGPGNEQYFYVLVCSATMLIVGALVRARVRRAETARLQRLGRPVAGTRSGAAARSSEQAIRGAGPRDDLASLRRARAIAAKSGVGAERA